MLACSFRITKPLRTLQIPACWPLKSKLPSLLLTSLFMMPSLLSAPAHLVDFGAVQILQLLGWTQTESGSYSPSFPHLLPQPGPPKFPLTPIPSPSQEELRDFSTLGLICRLTTP